MEKLVTDTIRVSQNEVSGNLTSTIVKNIEVSDRYFLESLRSSNYDIYKAIYELLDNGIDAGATRIEIIFDKERDIIIIKDNGSGMSSNRLMKSMDLGCDNVYTQNQIGYFGVGMKTGILNIIDINKDNPTISLITNDGYQTTKLSWEPKKNVKEIKYDVVRDTNHERGTTIIITGCKYFNPAPFKNSAGVVFYPTLKNGTVKIFLNEDEIIGTDPLYRDREKTISNFVDSVVENETIRINTVVIDEYEERTPWDAKKGPNGGWAFAKAGCYVIYGGRYIEVGGTSIIDRPFDSWWSRTRIEFTVPKNLTESFEVPFNKVSGLKVPREKMPDLWSKIWDQLTWGSNIRGKSKKPDATKDEIEENDELVKQLNKSAFNAGIKSPKTEEENKKEVTFKANPNKVKTEKETPTIKARIVEKQIYDFKFENMGTTSVFWRLAYEKNKFTIYLNTSHGFYREVYSDLNKKAKFGVMQLLASIALTQYRIDELGVSSNDEFFWDTYWSDVSLQLMKIMNN